MIPTLNAAGQWGVVPFTGVEMDFETWMAYFKFDKNAYGAVKGAAKFSTQPRPSRRSFQRTLLLTPPASPKSTSRRDGNPKTPSPPPPTLTTSSSSSSSNSSSSFSTKSSEAPPLFTTEFFEVRLSPKGGYGAFAIKDIEKDTVIMAEEPLFRAAYMEVYYKYEALSASQREDYRSLHGWRGVSEYQVLAIFKTNRFDTSEGKGGIFLKSSRFNHACHPFSTCTYSYDYSQGLLITKTLRAIHRGEEITISYCDAPNTLYGNYGFYCDCPGCPSPAKAKADIAFYRDGKRQAK